MIRHISIFELKNEWKENGTQKLISLLEEVASCKLIQKSVIGINITRIPKTAGIETPVFGDVIQSIDFRDRYAAAAYPRSIEHQNLLEQSKHMIEHVTAIDFEI